MCGKRRQRERAVQLHQLLTYQCPFVYFFPFLFLHCMCLHLSAYSRLISRPLFFLVAILTKRLVKVPACSQIWIRFARGLALRPGLLALRGGRKARARHGIFCKTPQFSGSGEIWEFPNIHISLSSLCISATSTGAKALHEENYPLTMWL